MDKFSKEELSLMSHTRAIIDPDASLDGVIWEVSKRRYPTFRSSSISANSQQLRVVPEGSENDGELRGVLINLLNKAENVSIITDSQIIMSIVYVLDKGLSRCRLRTIC